MQQSEMAKMEFWIGTQKKRKMEKKKKKKKKKKKNKKKRMILKKGLLGKEDKKLQKLQENGLFGLFRTKGKKQPQQRKTKQKDNQTRGLGGVRWPFRQTHLNLNLPKPNPPPKKNQPKTTKRSTKYTKQDLQKH